MNNNKYIITEYFAGSDISRYELEAPSALEAFQTLIQDEFALEDFTQFTKVDALWMLHPNINLSFRIEEIF